MVSRKEDVSLSEGKWAPAWLEGAAQSPVLGPLLPELYRLSATEAPILIEGEQGTEAELVARAIHALSPRATHPFAVIDCASLPAPLIEAELLGVNDTPPHKVGIFEHPGTVLLAEVGELTPRLQEACLRFLERHEIVRLGSKLPVPAPARCLASTSVDLRARVAAGLFRGDLHACLAAERLPLPPLRERAEEIPSLARHFLTQCSAPTRQRELAAEVEDLLKRYRWPGNLRELREAIEEAALRAHGGRIAPEHLPKHFLLEVESAPLPSLRDVERRHIARVLQEASGNQRHAARILGISRWSLSRRLRKYGVPPRPEA